MGTGTGTEPNMGIQEGKLGHGEHIRQKNTPTQEHRTDITFPSQKDAPPNIYRGGCNVAITEQGTQEAMATLAVSGAMGEQPPWPWPPLSAQLLRLEPYDDPPPPPPKKKKKSMWTVLVPEALHGPDLGTGALSGLYSGNGTLSGLNSGTGALSGLDVETGALSGLNSGTGALSGLDSESEALSGPDVGTTAHFGLDVETGALSGLSSGTASIEATEEATSFRRASVDMTRQTGINFLDKTRLISKVYNQRDQSHLSTLNRC